jgi:hypothetical protein
MYSVEITGSDIKVRKYLLDLILLYHAEGCTDGLAICDPEGVQWMTVQTNKILHEFLCLLLDQDLRLFPSQVLSHVDIIMAKYHLFCLFRQALDSRAIVKGIYLSDIRVVNPWNKIGNAKGQHPTFDMSQHATLHRLIFWSTAF